MTPYKAVCASISREKGVELTRILPYAWSNYEFKLYLRQLRRLNGDTPITLFMDNLGVHREKTVTPLYLQLNIKPIFNVPYFPDGNPIESIFSIVKRVFK